MLHIMERSGDRRKLIRRSLPPWRDARTLGKKRTTGKVESVCSQYRRAARKQSTGLRSRRSFLLPLRGRRLRQKDDGTGRNAGGPAGAHCQPQNCLRSPHAKVFVFRWPPGAVSAPLPRFQRGRRRRWLLCARQDPRGHRLHRELCRRPGPTQRGAASLRLPPMCGSARSEFNF
jgi:hypothetical protein